MKLEENPASSCQTFFMFETSSMHQLSVSYER